MNSRWSDDLRERMAKYEAPAPEALFEHIMEAIPTSQPASVVPLSGWRRWVAVAATVAVVAGGYLLLDRELQPDEELLAEAEQTIVTEQSDILEEVPTEELSSVAELAQITSQKRVAQLIRQKDIHVAEQPSMQPSEQPSTEMLSASTEEKNTQPAEEKSVQLATEKPTEKRGVAERKTNNYYAMLKPSEKRTITRLSANVFASGSAAGYTAHGRQQVFQVNSSLFGEQESSSLAAGTSGDMLLYNSNESLKTDIHHSQPVKFGFTLRYHITDKWAVESGVVYSMLHSRSQVGHTSNYSTDRQSLHYLGLPVSGVYNLWSNKRFVLYLSAGAMLEKCVSGSIKTTYTINGKNEKSQRRDLMVNELQFSVMASAGAQVNLSPMVGLYVEPGVGYWFDNGSAVQTIYGEQPLNFNLNLGLRFTLR